MEGKPASALQLWRNPILIRYVRARLRWKALILHTGLARSNAREMAAAPRVLSALGVLRNEKARP